MSRWANGTNGHQGPGRSYRLEVEKRSGWLVRRWRGRVVTIDVHGRRHHWRWRTGHSRQRLVRALWDDAMRDIEWRTGGRAPVAVPDPEAG